MDWSINPSVAYQTNTHTHNMFGHREHKREAHAHAHTLKTHVEDVYLY